MKLDDFLKCTKVRCVNFYATGLTNKEYELLGVTDRSCIINDNGCEIWASIDNFEPVPDQAENPLQEMKLTPEFETEASEFKFEVGNKVYKYGETDVKTVLEVFEDGYMRISNYPHRVNHEVICHATPENHALLSKPFPAIEFEQPPEPLTGSDLCRAMLYKGWKYVPCFVGNESDDFAQKTKLTDLIFALDGDRSKEFVGDDVWKYAVPIDLRTGLPLTESILND